MSGDRPPHAVLVRDPERFAAPAVAAVLGRRAGAPALDFVASARRAWGLVAESLPAADAEALAADLTAAGQPALAAPSSLLEETPPPTTVAKCELSGDGFDLVSGRANAAPERFSWTKLAALCAGAVEERTTATVVEGGGPREATERAVRLGLTVATGLPLMKAKAETKRVVERVERALVLDLLFLEPSRRLRVDARSFDFSVLGPRMTYAAEPNFLALLEELGSRAPAARRGRGTRALLARQPAARSLYESYEDLAREERWLLTLAALRAAP